MKYCVWQMCISQVALLWPVRRVAGPYDLEAAQAEAIRRNNEIGDKPYQHWHGVAFRVYNYAGPRPNKSFDIVKCGSRDCDCEVSHEGGRDG